MFKFHFIRSTRDLVGHLILIGIPVLLITFFNYIFTENLIEFEFEGNYVPRLAVLTIGFALTFQIFGASISFEVLGSDYFGPMYDRLLASPIEPRAHVFSTLVVGCLVSFLQTLVILLFSALVLKADLGPWPVILPILFLAVIFNQLLGTVILFLSKSVKVSNSILTIYGIVAPLSIGLYIPLPQNTFFTFLENYLSPLALANSAVLGTINGNALNISIGVGSLILMSGGLYGALKPLIRRLSV